MREWLYVRMLRGGSHVESPAPDGCKRALGFVFEPGLHVIRRRANESGDLAKLCGRFPATGGVNETV